MNFYWQIINIIKISSFRWNKTGILRGCSRVSTVVWLHQMDFNRAFGVTKLDGNYTRIRCDVFNKFWKQHLTKQQLYGHLPFISQTIQVRRICSALLENHGWNHKRNSPVNSYIWTHQCWATSKYLYSSALCGHGIPSWGSSKSYER